MPLEGVTLVKSLLSKLKEGVRSLLFSLLLNKTSFFTCSFFPSCSIHLFLSHVYCVYSLLFLCFCVHIPSVASALVLLICFRGVKERNDISDNFFTSSLSTWCFLFHLLLYFLLCHLVCMSPSLSLSLSLLVLIHSLSSLLVLLNKSRLFASMFSSLLSTTHCMYTYPSSWLHLHCLLIIFFLVLRLLDRSLNPLSSVSWNSCSTGGSKKCSQFHQH